MAFIDARIQRMHRPTTAERQGIVDTSEMPAKDKSLETPVVDETWTKADVRRLARLILKRAGIIMQIKDLDRKIMIVDFECSENLDELLREAR